MANTLYYFSSSTNTGATATAAQVCEGPCVLRYYDATNADGSIRFIQLFDVSGSGDATVGQPQMVIGMAGTSAKTGNPGVYFANGIAWTTTTAVDGTAAPSTPTRAAFGIELRYATGSTGLTP